jgi:ribosomal-protein-alanine N-acetyltransferase
MRMKAPYLKSSRIYLKPIGLEHLTSYYVNWLNDPDVNKFLDSGGDYTIELLEKFLIEMIEKDILFWAIHLNENNKHIGNIKIDPVNSKHGLAEYGILMGDKTEWGKGFAKEASQIVIDYCFQVLNIRKMILGVVEDNQNAVELYKKLGFQIEGLYKFHGKYNGKFCNTLRMALFNKTYIE